MNVKTLLYYAFFLTFLSDTLDHLFTLGETSITYVTASIKFLSLFFLLTVLRRSNWRKEIPGSVFFLLQLFIAWNVITIVRGGLNAKDYWDWKVLALTSSISLLIPIAVVSGILIYENEKIFSFILHRLFPFGFILGLVGFLLKSPGLYAWIMISVCLFLLIIPYIKPKYRILVYCVSFLSILLGHAIRANIIRVGAAFLLTFTYKFKYAFRKFWFTTFILIFLITPGILLYLGVTGQFNIFKIEEGSASIQTDNDDNDEDVGADTRTMLYQEVFLSMAQNNTLIFGEGASGKYASESFDPVGDGRGRYGTEVGFLDTLLYSGLVGVAIYGLLLFVTAFYAVFRSNNFLSKVMGVFVAFRWVLFFIEDIPSYNMNYFTLWLIIGLCLSEKFRRMSDVDIKSYFIQSTQNLKGRFF